MMDNYDWLFRERKIGSMRAPNLVVANPLERSDGTAEGKPSESSFARYRKLAEGGWGILFVECTTASDNPAERGHFPDGLMLNVENKRVRSTQADREWPKKYVRSSVEINSDFIKDEL